MCGKDAGVKNYTVIQASLGKRSSFRHNDQQNKAFVVSLFDFLRSRISGSQNFHE
jgi:hypothetical protein